MAGTFSLKREAERILLDDSSGGNRGRPGSTHHHFQGDSSSYLTPATGEPSFDLPRMLRAELAAVVRIAIQQVAKQGTAVDSVVRLKHDNGVKAIRVEVVPLEGRRAEGRDFWFCSRRSVRKPSPPRPPLAHVKAATRAADRRWSG